jgi:uncharacterized RDD family membrane protein YckC
MSGPEPGTPPGASPPAAPPPASPPPGDAWAAAPPPAAAQVPGQAGLFYADVPNRIVALIIDAIIVGIVSAIVFIVVYGVFGSPTSFGGLILTVILGIAISAGYYIYTWTRMRGTVGMKALGMQVGNAFDGVTLTTEQGVKRWIALGGPLALAQVFSPIGFLGFIFGLAGLIWVIALLYTTATSPTKQGLHDKYANSVVVKAARSVG